MQRHKIVKPKDKIKYFLEIYVPLEPKLVSNNYILLHNLLPVRGGSECKLCSGVEYNIYAHFV